MITEFQDQLGQDVTVEVKSWYSPQLGTRQSLPREGFALRPSACILMVNTQSGIPQGFPKPAHCSPLMGSQRQRGYGSELSGPYDHAPRWMRSSRGQTSLPTILRFVIRSAYIRRQHSNNNLQPYTQTPLLRLPPRSLLCSSVYSPLILLQT